MTISKLPLGPSAHFRLTSVFLSKEINGHGNPTSHAPELVLSNMATPLGLSIGRLLGAMFPPLPQIQGRQVVAVHNQRDYIFLRRYRYMFAVRGDTELEQERAKERGMDPTVRTRMQEIGPRLTLKLRWLKRGTLETGRRKGGGNVTGAHKQAAEDKADVEVAEFNPDEAQADGGAAPDEDVEPPPVDEVAKTDAPVETREPTAKPAKRKKPRTHTSKGGIRIPRLSIPEASTADARNDFRRKKRKAGDSILDGVFLQGGMKDEALEWQWNVRACCLGLTDSYSLACRSASASTSCRPRRLYNARWTMRSGLLLQSGCTGLLAEHRLGPRFRRLGWTGRDEALVQHVHVLALKVGIRALGVGLDPAGRSVAALLEVLSEHGVLYDQRVQDTDRRTSGLLRRATSKTSSG